MKIDGKSYDITPDNYTIIRQAIYNDETIEIDYPHEKKQLVKVIDKIPMLNPSTNQVEFVSFNLLFFYTIKKHYRVKDLPFLDEDALKKKYIIKMFNYSSALGKNLTSCIKPSYHPQLSISSPYYTKPELLNLALNMRLISEETIKGVNLEKLCQIVRDSEVSRDELEVHFKYIHKTNKQALVRNYSLFDAYFINQSVRHHEFKDSVLNKKIFMTKELLDNSPAFNNRRVVYRFVQQTPYLNDLKLGDIYETDSFISTTRNPFYDPEQKIFGQILLKIILPAGITGIGLCIENYSLFQREEEIIIAPFCQFKLLSIDKDTSYYHYNYRGKAKLIKVFELEFANKLSKSYFKKVPKINKSQIPELQFESIPKNVDKINYFATNYCNYFKQFKLTRQTKTLYFNCVYYDSSCSSPYSQFFFFKVSQGFMIYNLNMETLSYDYTFEISDNRLIVNYQNRFMPSTDELNEDELIELLTIFAQVFNIELILIFPQYSSCSRIGGSDFHMHNKDLHTYITSKTPRFKNPKIKSNYDFKLIEQTQADKRFFKENPEIQTLITESMGLIDLYNLLLEKHPEVLKEFYNVLDIYTDMYYSIDVSDLLPYRNSAVEMSLDMGHTRNYRV